MELVVMMAMAGLTVVMMTPLLIPALQRAVQPSAQPA